MTEQVAVLFERLGPYHHARLAAAMGNVGVAAIEIYTRDDTYAWEVDHREVAFERKTLFRDADAKPSVRLMVESVWGALDRAGPVAVAIPGWSASYAMAALSWCVSRGVSSIMMSESTAEDDGRRWWREAIKRRLVGLCGAALVGGQRHRTYMKLLGMADEQIFTGYDVVENDYFASKADAAREDDISQRTRHSLPPRYFLASNRFVEKKNIFRLLEAFARYRKVAQIAGDAAWDMVLLGDGKLRPAVEKQISALGVGDAVSLPGFKQYGELPSYYGLASAFVHASTVDQWGLVVNEAMSTGLPVIISERCGCVPDLLAPGRNGFSFDPYDVAELAQHMAFVASDKCDRAAMGAASRQIIARWSPQTFAENLAKSVDVARAAPRRKPRLLDKGLLAALVHR